MVIEGGFTTGLGNRFSEGLERFSTVVAGWHMVFDMIVEVVLGVFSILMSLQLIFNFHD